jgi:hypothetical protein
LNVILRILNRGDTVRYFKPKGTAIRHERKTRRGTALGRTRQGSHFQG